MSRVLSDRIIFDESDWLPGFAPHFGSSEIVKEGPGLAYMESLDVFRETGYAIPAYDPTLATNYATELTGTLIAGIAKTANLAYFLSDDGKIHEHTLTTNTLTATSWPIAIAHGAHGSHVGSDMVIYDHNVGGTLQQSAFYSFYDATDFDVGTYGPLAGAATNDDDFMSTVPASPLAGADLTDGQAAPHPMAVGRDGILYIGSRRYLHAYDGTNGANGTVEAQALDIEPGWIITSVLKGKKYLMAFAYRPPTPTATAGDARGESEVFYWDYISPTFNFSESLHDNYVTGGFMFRDQPACFTFGRKGLDGKKGKLRLRTGDTWNVASYFANDYPVNRGVDMVGEQAIFETSGELYAYGSPDPKRWNDGLYHIGNLGGATRGCVHNFKNDEILVSSGAFLEVLKNNYGLGQLLTRTVAPITGSGKQAKVKYIRVYFRKAAASGRELQLAIRMDGGTVEQTFFQSPTVTAGDLVRDYHYDTSNGRFKTFEDIALYGIWNSGSGATDAPAINRVEVFYDLERKILGKQ